MTTDPVYCWFETATCSPVPTLLFWEENAMARTTGVLMFAIFTLLGCGRQETPESAKTGRAFDGKKAAVMAARSRIGLIQTAHANV